MCLIGYSNLLVGYHSTIHKEYKYGHMSKSKLRFSVFLHGFTYNVDTRFKFLHFRCDEQLMEHTLSIQKITSGNCL